jgi:hypothetical protein
MRSAQALPVDESPVAAAQVFHPVAVSLLHQAGVPPRDAGRIDLDIDPAIAPEHHFCAFQRVALALVGTLL